jgi:D-amino-acid oxidase
MFDVVVVGAGVIGLSCAMRLQHSGARVAVVSPDGPEQTTSWVAAAVWYPTHTAADPQVLGWAGRTFEEFARQAAQGVPGVTMRATRMLLRGATEPPWWTSVVPDFRCVAAAEPYTGEWRFTVPAVEMGTYLNWQLQQIVEAGGTLLTRRLERLGEVADLAPVTVNATGLAARRLAADDTVQPIRGRLVIMTNPGLTVSVRDEENPAGLTYVHPRGRDVVLGGTFEPGESDLTPDPVEGRAILARCTALVPELAGAEVITQLAGLRPGRAGGVRLGLDPATGTGRLIHNYGHGGAGMTLSWGCADEVAALAA